MRGWPLKFATVALATTLTSTGALAHVPELTGTPVNIDTGTGNFLSGRNIDESAGMTGHLAIDKDISGAICLVDGRCFAASDETRFVQQFSLTSGGIKPGQRLYLKKTSEGKERAGDVGELDFEALARHQGGVFAIGSHSWKRNRCKVHTRRHVIYYFKPRFESADPRAPQASASFSLDETFTRYPQLSAALARPLQRNGLNIEGAAVLAQRLFIGFRAPYDRHNPFQGFILSLAVSAAENGRAVNPRLHTLTFPHKGTGIRAMEPLQGGLLLLTGNAGARAAKGKNGNPPPEECKTASLYRKGLTQLFFWNRIGTTPHLVANIKLPAEDLKAEALMLHPDQPDGGGPVRVIIFFDGARNGSPHIYDIPRDLF